MRTYACHECRGEIAADGAHLRSVAFELQAFCDECWAALTAPAVPSPRVSEEDVAAFGRHRARRRGSFFGLRGGKVSHG